MIKFFIAAVVVVGVCMGVFRIVEYWGKFKDDGAPSAGMTIAQSSGDSLPGMPQNLENTYQASRNRGVVGLHDFLNSYGRSVSDPRLGSIQLDYTVLVAQRDPAEAQRMYKLVKSRTTADSPVYARVQQLQKTYE